MKAALIKLGWNNEHDRHRLLRIIIKRIEVAKGMIRSSSIPRRHWQTKPRGYDLSPRPSKFHRTSSKALEAWRSQPESNPAISRDD